MPNDIHFFISSLPLLKPGQKPLLSHQQFIQACQVNLAAEPARQLADLKLDPPEDGQPLPRFDSARQWLHFETFLRNGAAEARAVRLKMTPPVPQPTDLISQYTQKLIADAFNKANPAEREDILDQARWNALEQLDAQHQFDLDALAVYTLKLLLLERIQSRQVQPGLECFNQLVQQAVQQANDHRVQA